MRERSDEDERGVENDDDDHNAEHRRHFPLLFVLRRLGRFGHECSPLPSASAEKCEEDEATKYGAEDGLPISHLFVDSGFADPFFLLKHMTSFQLLEKTCCDGDGAHDQHGGNRSPRDEKDETRAEGAPDKGRDIFEAVAIVVGGVALHPANRTAIQWRRTKDRKNQCKNVSQSSHGGHEVLLPSCAVFLWYDETPPSF